MSAPATPQNGRPADTAENAIGALNAKTRQRQRMLLLGGGGAVAMVGLWFVLGGSPHHTSAAPDAPQRIETDGIVNRDLSQKEFVAIYGNRLDAQARQLKALEDSRAVNPDVQSKLDALAAENQAMRTDGAHTIDALTQENSSLKGELARAQSTPPLTSRSATAASTIRRCRPGSTISGTRRRASPMARRRRGRSTIRERWRPASPAISCSTCRSRSCRSCRR